MRGEWQLSFKAALTTGHVRPWLGRNYFLVGTYLFQFMRNLVYLWPMGFHVKWSDSGITRCTPLRHKVDSVWTRVGQQSSPLVDELHFHPAHIASSEVAFGPWGTRGLELDLFRLLAAGVHHVRTVFAYAALLLSLL